MKVLLSFIIAFPLSFYGQFVQIFGDEGTDYGYSFQKTADSGYLITGYTASNYDVIWFLKTDQEGKVEWSKSFGGAEEKSCNTIEQVNNSGCFVAGYTYSYSNLSEDLWLIKGDVWLIKKDSNSTFVLQDGVSSNNIEAFPNPTNGKTTLQTKEYSGPIQVEVFDFSGKLLKVTRSRIIDLQDYSRGVYVFQVSYGGISQEIKVIRD